MSTNKTSPNYQVVNDLAGRLAKSEKYHGKKEGREVQIGDFREILADLADEAAKDPAILQALHRYGMERKRDRRAAEAEELKKKEEKKTKKAK